MPTIIRMRLLPALRRAKGGRCTQRVLGELSGTTNNTISLIERGYASPSSKVLGRIARAIGWPGEPSELLEEIELIPRWPNPEAVEEFLSVDFEGRLAARDEADRQLRLDFEKEATP